MTANTMIKQLRIFEIIILCILARSLQAKPLNKLQHHIHTQKDERVKRGYSHYGGNDFGSSVHVSSGVLQYSNDGEHYGTSDSSGLTAVNVGHSDSIDTSSHFEASASKTDPWAAAGLSAGYDVWLEHIPSYQTSSDLDSSIVHTPSLASKHLLNDDIANTVFSNDATYSGDFPLTSSQLHTQIGSSSFGDSALDIGSSIHDLGTVAISDNIDFNNNDDLKTKHYAKSYGK